MFEWYDLRMIDLYPEDEALDGEPREEIAEDEGDLAPETITAD